MRAALLLVIFAVLYLTGEASTAENELVSPREFLARALNMMADNSTEEANSSEETSLQKQGSDQDSQSEETMENTTEKQHHQEFREAFRSILRRIYARIMQETNRDTV